MRKMLIALLAVAVLASASQAAEKKAAPKKGAAKKEATAVSEGGKTSDQQVSFITPDGYMLKGEYFPAGKGSPAVLLLHKLGSNRAELIGLAKALQQRGISALAYDARGHGQSAVRNGKASTYEGFTRKDWEDMTVDIDTALHYLHQSRRLPKGTPVGIVGASIQSSTGLLYAARHPEVKVLVMLSPGLDYHGIDTAGPMKSYDGRPVYLVSSIEDSPSYKAAKELERIASGPKKRETLSDGGHGAEMFRKDPKLEDRIADWLKDTLK